MAERLSAWLRHGDVHRYVESHLYGSDFHSSGRVSNIQSPTTKKKIFVKKYELHLPKKPTVNLPILNPQRLNSWEQLRNKRLSIRQQAGLNDSFPPMWCHFGVF